MPGILWVAENAGATHFLTCDYKLMRHLSSHRRFPPRVSVVTPRKLLADLLFQGVVNPFAFLRALAAEVIYLRRQRPSTVEEVLARHDDKLDRAGYYD